MDLGPRRGEKAPEQRIDCEMTREIHVAFIEEKLKKAFDKLKKGKFEDRQLYHFIDRAMDDLKANPTCGIQIPSKLIPKEYIKKYKISNLWKYDLPNAWRLLYTIKANEVLIVSVVIEWLSHKDYEKRFKYKKR